MSRVACLLDGNRGIYIPQTFARDFIFKGEEAHRAAAWEGAKAEDLETLRKGAEEEFYWEAWDNVLQSAFYKVESGGVTIDGVWFKGGTVFRLEQDGDLWMCDDREDES